MERNIFKKVAASEKRILFKSAVYEKIEFIAKGESDQIFRFLVTEITDKNILKISSTPHSEKMEPQRNLIVNFGIGTDRYFMQANLNGTDTDWFLDVESEIFILQRRKTPRLVIPSDYEAHINISQFKGKNVFLECRILDFSSGGCRLEYNKDLPYFKTDDSFKAFVHIGSKAPIELECLVRHTHSMGNVAILPQVFGVQFTPLTFMQENRLLVVFMDLQRQVLFKN